MVRKGEACSQLGPHKLEPTLGLRRKCCCPAMCNTLLDILQQPVLQEVSTIDTINASNLFFYNVVVKGDLMGQSPLTAPSHGWVDARDVAELHVRSLEVPEASDEKFLVVSGQFVWQDACKYLSHEAQSVTTC